jgi:hypothetical protein
MPRHALDNKFWGGAGEQMVKVLHGKHGFLFLGGDDSNDLIAQHTGRRSLFKEISAIRYAHFARSNGLMALYSSRYLHVISPNKETIAADFMPSEIVYEANGPTPVNAYLNLYPGVKDYTFFDTSVMKDFFDSRLYYLTDTHWTFRGAKRYLEAALGQAGFIEQKKILEELPLRIDHLPFVGDLAIHISHPGETQEHILPAVPHFTQLFYNGIGTEGRVFHFSNRERAGRVMMLIDSTGSWMLNYMAELFGEVLAVHASDLDLRVVELYKPDFVLAVQCERFFLKPPRDGADWRDVISSNESRKSASASAVAYLSNLKYMD